MQIAVNMAQIAGRLGRDPEIRRTQSGDAIANLNVATTKSWKDKGTGEWKDKTEWHRVVVFNQAKAGFIEKHLKKGDLVYVMGSLQTRKWSDKDGVERYQTEIVVEAFFGDVQVQSPAKDSDGALPKSAPASGNTSKSLSSDLDDDIPF